MRLAHLVPVLAAAAAAVIAAAAPAYAASMRYLAYEASTEASQWRTGDVTLAIRKGVINRRIDTFFRRKGSDLPLTASDAPFNEYALGHILGDRDPGSVRLYGIEAKAAERFTGFACEGKAEKAWLAVSTPKPYKPLQVWVVRWDAEARAPALCVALDYRFRGEWQFPPRPNSAAEYASPTAARR